MEVRVCAFTQRGLDLARRIEHGLRAQGDAAACAACFGPGKQDLRAWCSDAFASADALVFVGAAGIAVRAVAPHISSKMHDPAVVCVDEGGAWCIPLLSGHVGGANALARRIAALVGAQACVTTATDVRGLWAVDEWAARRGMSIVGAHGAKRVSAELLAGRTVRVGSSVELLGEPPSGVLLDSGRPDEGLDVWIGPETVGAPLRLVPRCTVVGIGCRRGEPASAIRSAVAAFLEKNGIDPRSVASVASIDRKADEAGIVELAASLGTPFLTFSAEVLNAQKGAFVGSDFVAATVGTDNVCERAVVAAGASVAVPKTVVDGVALSLGRMAVSFSFEDGQPDGAGEACAATAVPQRREDGPRVLQVVGIGPGDERSMTGAALAALREADAVYGYGPYLDLARDAIGDKPVFSTPMRGEVDRCRMALEAAASGRRAALVCSGDAGVYGMAGLALELADEYPGVEVEVVPGVTAALSGAALLGAPLGHDFAVVSLSDLLTPWDAIERRLRAAAEADLALAIYNPASRKRGDHLRRACDVLLEHKSPQTACGVARNVGRDGEAAWTCSLEELREARLDMFCTVFVGAASTRVVGGRLVTPRGYRTDAQGCGR